MRGSKGASAAPASLAQFVAEERAKVPDVCVICRLPEVQEINAARLQKESGAVPYKETIGAPQMVLYLRARGHREVTLHQIKRHFSERHHEAK